MADIKSEEKDDSAAPQPTVKRSEIDLKIINAELDKNGDIFLIKRKLYGISHQVSPSFTNEILESCDDKQIKLNFYYIAYVLHVHMMFWHL